MNGVGLEWWAQYKVNQLLVCFCVDTMVKASIFLWSLIVVLYSRNMNFQNIYVGDYLDDLWMPVK